MERQGSRRNPMKTALSGFGAADAPANGQCGSPSARCAQGAQVGRPLCTALQWNAGQAAGIRADERHARRCSSSPVNGAVRSPAFSGSECDTPEGSSRLRGTTVCAPRHDRTRPPEGAGNAIAPCPHDRTGLGPQGRSHGQWASDAARNAPPPLPATPACRRRWSPDA